MERAVVGTDGTAGAEAVTSGRKVACGAEMMTPGDLLLDEIVATTTAPGVQIVNAN